jgi:murein DD-endopeptidase MepM/ murein hydrolase activator NlpD
MKKRRQRKSTKWTILVMSDANKKVIQLKVPKILTLIVSGVFLSLTIALLFTQFNLQQTTQKNNSLEHDLNVINNEMMDATKKISFYKEEAKTLNDEVLRLSSLEQELKDMITALDPEFITEGFQEPTGGIEFSSESYLESKNSDISLLALKRDVNTNLTEFYQELGKSIPELVTRYQTSIDSFSEIQNKLVYTPTYWPANTSRITSEFGTRSDPFTARSAVHTGIDIAGPYGTEIYAAADGIVQLARVDGGYGNSIVIQHTSNLKTRYGHLSSIAVEEGQSVKKGDVIGYMGSTGRSTGVHLHYEILQNSIPIDPYPYMTFMKRVTNKD